VPPLAQSANAEAMAGESSAVPLEPVYLEGIVQVLPTVEFCARTAEAPKPTERSNESILEATQRMVVYETFSRRAMERPYTYKPLNCHNSIESSYTSTGIMVIREAQTNLYGWKQFVRRRSRLEPRTPVMKSRVVVGLKATGLMQDGPALQCRRPVALPRRWIVRSSVTSSRIVCP
jgi:hypothetical protein